MAARPQFWSSYQVFSFRQFGVSGGLLYYFPLMCSLHAANCCEQFSHYCSVAQLAWAQLPVLVILTHATFESHPTWFAAVTARPRVLGDLVMYSSSCTRTYSPPGVGSSHM